MKVLSLHGVLITNHTMIFPIKNLLLNTILKLVLKEIKKVLREVIGNIQKFSILTKLVLK